MDSNHMWKILMGIAISILVVGAQEEREHIIPVVRRYIPTCPKDAVCANVWRTDSQPTRSILSCRCENSGEFFDDRIEGACEYLNPTDSNSVFQSRRNQEVLCPRTLRRCRPGEVARERKSGPNGLPYFAVHCRCPLHNLMTLMQYEEDARATYSNRTTNYKCAPDFINREQ
ncbi:uncharacterized protein [Argopecten irradians]